MQIQRWDFFYGEWGAQRNAYRKFSGNNAWSPSLVEAIDTTTATGQFFFQITGAFAELERNLMRERTRAGLVSARQRGRCGGRPKAIDAETFAMAVQLYHAETTSVQSICTRLGIARRTFYRYLAAQPS